MIALGRTLWIASLIGFLGVAFFYPVTVETRVPTSTGLSGLDELLRYSVPKEVINLPAVANQLLLAIGLAQGVVVGALLDIAGTMMAALRPIEVVEDTSATPATNSYLPPLLRHDENGAADPDHLRELGIEFVDGKWTIDGKRMPDWKRTVDRAIWIKRFRLD